MTIKALTFTCALVTVTLFVSAYAPTSYAPATLDFAADNFADLFLNGAKIASLYSWSHFSTIELVIKPGDIIAINAKDVGSKYGVIADLNIGNGQFCQTKVGQGPWKAIKASPQIPNTWTQSYYNYAASAWPYPGPSNISPPHPGSAKYFPYEYGAEYVWANGAGEHSTIYLRLVVPKECATLDEYAH